MTTGGSAENTKCSLCKCAVWVCTLHQKSPLWPSDDPGLNSCVTTGSFLTEFSWVTTRIPSDRRLWRSFGIRTVVTFVTFVLFLLFMNILTRQDERHVLQMWKKKVLACPQIAHCWSRGFRAGTQLVDHLWMQEKKLRHLIGAWSTPWSIKC